MEKWEYYLDVCFNDKSFNEVHIDTRDFHCLCCNDDSNKLYNTKHTLTSDELKALLIRYEYESGGKIDWRDLMTDSHKFWDLKYLKCVRIDDNRWVVCNVYGIQLSTDELNEKAYSYLSNIKRDGKDI